MSDPICGVLTNIVKPVWETPLYATVLSVKRYPSEEFGVMIHSTGAVVTIKDVKIFVTNSLSASNGPASGLLSGSQDTRDIQEGTQLVLNDVGVWNVNTTALHHARVTIGDRVDIGLGGASDDNARKTPTFRMANLRITGVATTDRTMDGTTTDATTLHRGPKDLVISYRVNANIACR
jgi:hypothetical protein